MESRQEAPDGPLQRGTCSHAPPGQGRPSTPWLLPRSLNSRRAPELQLAALEPCARLLSGLVLLLDPFHLKQVLCNWGLGRCRVRGRGTYQQWRVAG